MMKFKYLQIGASGLVWGINEYEKPRFIAAVVRGDTIINLETMQIFDKETNSWKDVDGDRKVNE